MRAVRRLAGVLLVVGSVGLHGSMAGAGTVTRAQVVDSLSGFEREPTVTVVRSWGTDGITLLMDIAGDPAALAHTRVRAVHALRAYGTSVPVRGFLRTVAARESGGLFLRRAALDALVEGCGDVTEVSRYLTDSHADVRDGAAWALSLAITQAPNGATGTAARDALAARLATEPDETVRVTLRTAMRPATR